MHHLKALVVSLAVASTLAFTLVAQEPPPVGAFKAVHLLNLKTAAEVTALQAAMTDMNTAVSNAGHRNIRYRLYKVTGTQAGMYNYMFESSWPSGEVYQKVHKSEDWMAASKKHQLEARFKDAIYNRYVEVAASK